VYKAELTNVAYSEEYAPVVLEDLSFDDPEAREVVDNFGTSSTQSSQLVFSQVVTTSETTTITESKSYSVSVGLSVGFEASIIGGPSTEVSFEFGTSFSTASEESKTVEFSTSIERVYEVVAAPGTRVTAEVFYREIQYMFNWEGPVVCYFEFAPSTQVSGSFFKGTMGGSQPFPEGYVVLTEEMEVPTEVPAEAPTEAPAEAPTEAPAEVPEGGEVNNEPTSPQDDSSGIRALVFWEFIMIVGASLMVFAVL
jgi:hypothetical protein